MSKNPERLEVEIFIGENALPVLSGVKASYGHGLENFEGLRDDEIPLLLAHPETVWLENREAMCTQGVEYTRVREFGQRSHEPNRLGALIFVSYEIADR